MPQAVRTRRPRAAGVLLALVGALLVAAATLTPQGDRVDSSFGHWCVTCGRLGGADVVNNVVLFLPLGLGLGLAGVRRGLALALVVGATTCVELLQASIVSGRYATLGDVLMNAAGGALGWTLAAHGAWLFQSSPRASRRLALAAGAAWLSVLAASAWAMERDASPGPPSARRVPPAPTTLSWFHGRVPRVALGPEDIASPDAYPVSVARALPASGMRVDAWVTPSPRPEPRLAFFAVVYDDARQTQLVLGQHGRDLVFHVRVRAARVRLRQPSVVLEDVFPDPATVVGDAGVARTAVHVFGASRGHEMIAGVERGGYVVRRTVRRAPTQGWVFFAPFVHGLGRRSPAYTALWLGALVVPAGYWTARWLGDAAGTTARTRALWLPALLALGLGVLPSLSGASVASGSEWAASVLGTSLGWACGRWSLRLRTPRDGVAMHG